MILILLPLSLLAGLLGGREIVNGIYVLAALVIILGWVQRDTKKRKTEFRWPLRIAMILFTAFALPFYFFQSRGWLGGLKLTAQAWAIFIASMLCYRIGYSF